MMTMVVFVAKMVGDDNDLSLDDDDDTFYTLKDEQHDIALLPPLLPHLQLLPELPRQAFKVSTSSPSS